MSSKQPQDEHLYDMFLDIAENAGNLRGVLPKFLASVGEIHEMVPMETAISVVSQSGKGEDAMHWFQGYIVRGMIKNQSYGDRMNSLDDLARSTNRSTAELREKMDCADYWDPIDVLELYQEDEHDFLSWSHFNRARRGLERHEAVALVRNAMQHGWSVSRMEAEKRKAQGEEEPDEEKDEVTEKIKRAVYALGQLSGIGLPGEIMTQASRTRRMLEEVLD